MNIEYHLMNGLGNQFLIIDARSQSLDPQKIDSNRVKNLAKNYAIDQLIIIAPAARSSDTEQDNIDGEMLVWNQDGSRVDACGNAARCVGWLISATTDQASTSFNVGDRLQSAQLLAQDLVKVNMGRPKLGWEDIPLNGSLIDYSSDTDVIELQIGPIDDPILHSPGCVSMGNPHCVFFVHDLSNLDIENFGPLLENHPIFPKAANIGFAQIRSEKEIRLRVWERGAGLTRACGTGACAAVVAAHRRKLALRNVDVELDGGHLQIIWDDVSGDVWQTGAVEWTGRGSLHINSLF